MHRFLAKRLMCAVLPFSLAFSCSCPRSVSLLRSVYHVCQLQTQSRHVQSVPCFTSFSRLVMFMSSQCIIIALCLSCVSATDTVTSCSICALFYVFLSPCHVHVLAVYHYCALFIMCVTYFYTVTSCSICALFYLFLSPYSYTMFVSSPSVSL